MTDTETAELEPDPGRTRALTEDLARVVKAFYLAHARDQRSVLEVLNALGCIVAMVAVGTAPDGLQDSLNFFGEAVSSQLNNALQQMAEAAERDRGGAPLN